MAYFYSKSTKGFYSDALHTTMPPDAVAVTDEAYAGLFAAQEAGHIIAPDADGIPVAAAPVVLPPTLVQQATALVAAGLSITSTSTPELNSIYSCDAAAVSHVQSEMLCVLVTGNFADGTTSVSWSDIAGNVHLFPSVELWKPFALALAAFVAAAIKVQNGVLGALPSAFVTIP